MAMIRCIILTLVSITAYFYDASHHYASAVERRSPPPKLIVMLVIDQFRADTLTRFRERFLPAESRGSVGGFNYLMERGAYYPLGEYDVLQCMTGPGHATVLSGSHPYLNGIAQNVWFDQQSQKPIYCVQDDSTELVGNPQPLPRAGSTPLNFLGSTVGDELKNSGYHSKVISVALKDRAAILMGGHRADLALWHDPKVMHWISSKKYRPDSTLPEWVNVLNADVVKNSKTPGEWTIRGPGSGMSTEHNFTSPARMFGKTGEFPHAFQKSSPDSLRSPVGVSMTIDAAVAALRAEKLGHGNSPDLLAVSISTHDYVAHSWGPNSREVEEITVAEDREISRFLNALAKEVPGGLKNVVLAMTADHGGGHTPELLASVGVPAGRIDSEAVKKRAEERLVSTLGKAPEGQAWIPWVYDFAFYLNEPALAKKAVDAYAKAEAILKQTVESEPGVMMAITRTEAAEKRWPAGDLGKRVAMTYFPGRSGNVMLLPKPNFFENDDTAGHITPYAYDRYVPIILVGDRFKPRRYPESAKVVDIAPTLSFLLGITPPSLSEGRVLSEALR